MMNQQPLREETARPESGERRPYEPPVVVGIAILADVVRKSGGPLDNRHFPAKW